jgi:hypothetical protein
MKKDMKNVDVQGVDVKWIKYQIFFGKSYLHINSMM